MHHGKKRVVKTNYISYAKNLPQAKHQIQDLYLDLFNLKMKHL